jgi:hypothetical protein
METKRYILVEVTDAHGFDLNLAAEIGRDLRKAWDADIFRAVDVTDLMTYNRSTPGDPWDKPYPAMYAEMAERLG